MTERPWYRKRIEAFRRIDAATRERFLAGGRPVRLVRRALVQNLLGPDELLVWVASGRIRLSRFEDDGAETAVAVIEPGECFSLGARADGRVGGTAEALEPSKVVIYGETTLGRAAEIAPLVVEELRTATGSAR